MKAEKTLKAEDEGETMKAEKAMDKRVHPSSFILHLSEPLTPYSSPLFPSSLIPHPSSLLSE
jgi:hypothetical protein